MNSRIRDLINQTSSILVYNPNLDSYGYLISEFNITVVNSNLSELEIDKVILHELGHIIHEEGDCTLYNSTFCNHSKEEHNANEYMLNELIDEYVLKNDVSTRDINYCIFAKQCNISDLDMIKSALKRKMN